MGDEGLTHRLPWLEHKLQPRLATELVGVDEALPTQPLVGQEGAARNHQEDNKGE